MRGQILGVMCGGAVSLAAAAPPPTGTDLEDSPSRLSDEVIPLQIDKVPDRPGALLELGDPLLAPGPIGESLVSPTGEVLQPALTVFGTYRTALQTFDNGEETFTEWANRLDLFANLQLSGTSRVVYGVRPLDEGGDFSGYNFEPGERDGWRNELNWRTTTLFFEGELAEMFPGLDPDDSRELDLGFSVGRQQLLFQDGLIINDRIDSVALVKNSISAPGVTNLRVTALWGWDEINRGNNRGEPNPEDDSAAIYGVFFEADTEHSILALDLVYVTDDDTDSDAFYAGASATQRFGAINSTFRLATSVPTEEDSPEVTGGTLLMAELSTGLHHSDDLVYVNGFWGIDEFTSAARSPETGGPLGQVGILYSSAGLGRFGAPLGNDTEDSVGFAVGRQFFFDDTRKQLILELAGRTDTDGSDRAAVAGGARWQQAIGQNTVMRLDGFAAGREGRSPAYGARIEFLYKF